MENLINLYGENIKNFELIIVYTTYGITFYYGNPSENNNNNNNNNDNIKMLTTKKEHKIDLQFIYLNNLTPQSFFFGEIEFNVNMMRLSILENMFEQFIKTGKNLQLLFDNTIKMCSFDKVLRYLNLYLKEIIKSKTLLIAYNEEKFKNFFKQVPITKSLSLYKTTNKNVIYVDFGYVLEIRNPLNNNNNNNNNNNISRKCYQDINITTIILKFREFLSTRYKIKISSYRVGKILKSLNGLKNAYNFYGPTKFIQIASKDLILFFRNLLKNNTFIIRGVVGSKKRQIFITNSFFTHNTTMDILDLIIIYVNTNSFKRKREEEEKIQIFTYGVTLNLKESTVIGFLTQTNKCTKIYKKQINFDNNFNFNSKELQKILDEDKNMICQLLIYIKKYHPKEYSMIDSEFIVFISIKFKVINDLIPILSPQKGINTHKKLIDKYIGLPMTLKTMLDKNTIFDFMDPDFFKNKEYEECYNEKTFLKSVIENKVFYFLKFNVFYVFGENFSSLRMLYLDNFRKTFNQRFKKIKKELTSEDISYYEKNVTYFISDTEDYIPKLKRRKIS